jgi:hypothetical protein
MSADSCTVARTSTVSFKDQLHRLIHTKSWRTKNAMLTSAHIAGCLNEIRTEFFSTVSSVGLVYCWWFTDLDEVLSRIKLNKEFSEGLYSISSHTFYACEHDKYFSVSGPLLSMNCMPLECGLANLWGENCTSAIQCRSWKSCVTKLFAVYAVTVRISV